MGIPLRMGIQAYSNWSAHRMSLMQPGMCPAAPHVLACGKALEGCAKRRAAPAIHSSDYCYRGALHMGEPVGSMVNTRLSKVACDGRSKWGSTAWQAFGKEMGGKLK